MKFLMTLVLLSFLAVSCNKDSNQASGGGTGMQEEQQTPDNSNQGTQQ